MGLISFSINRCSLNSVLFLIGILIFFTACAGKKMSVEEAKQITVSMSGKSFVPPPRSINDILSILDQKEYFDFESIEKLKAKADRPQPKIKDKLSLSNFYYYRGEAASRLGRWNQALADYRTAIRYSEFKDPMLIQQLGVVEFICGNFKRAIELLELSLSKKEHPNTYAQLVKIYSRMGDLENAERLQQKGESLCNELQFQSGWNEWPKVHAARMKAYLFEAQGKPREAEKYYRRSLALLSPSSKRKYPIAAFADKIYLSRCLRKQGRLLEAESEARQALKEAIGFGGKDTEIVGITIGEVGEILRSQGRLKDAEKLARSGVRIIERSHISSDSYLMGQARTYLGNILTDRYLYDEAMKQYDLAREGLRQNQYLYQSVFTRNPNLVLSLLKTNRIREAIKLISINYDSNSNLFGKKYYLTSEILGLRGIANTLLKNKEQALLDFSKALPVLLDRTKGDTHDYSKDLRLKIIAETYIDLLSQIHGSQIENKMGINAIAEAFKISDAIRGHSVWKAIEASSLRAAIIDPDIADLVRREQDALKQIKVLQMTLVNSLSVPSEQQLPEINKKLILKIDTLTNARAVILDDIKRRFPKYSAYTNPQPLTLTQAQHQLKPDEALISVYTSENQTFVWAVPHKGDTKFAVVPLKIDDLKKIVTDLRKSLDPDPDPQTFGDLPAYDLNKAYELYNKLLKPVEKGWKDAKDLLVVATGPLEQLPFSVLPTASVKIEPEKNELFANYRRVPWLIRKVSITRCPSVFSVITLRKHPQGNSARKHFVGFGDPYFNQEQLTRANAEKIRQKVMSANLGERLHVRGIRVTETGSLDNEQITSSHLGLLNRLPDTAEEIKSIARALDADLTKDIFLGENASEHQVKTMDLSDRQVIAFATHALLAGDLDGLDQPAIALSAPTVTNDNEDGLLTMGEILKLKLNADWVVLSACNTGASDGAGTEAVSGLGRAFFYAGTRAILVSMWPVETTSAKKLTTGLFMHQKENPMLSRARALQESMLSLIDSPGIKDEISGKIIASYAHPLFWAPFTIIGDSGGNTKDMEDAP
jgi:CHAT domain-containing protein